MSAPQHPVAVFSPCRRYRYTLWRSWTIGDGAVVFIGLNPSTADETRDDPTIRRCIRFAQDWGFQRMCMLNVFAFRATKPAVMFNDPDPVGPDNDLHILRACADARLRVAAWGTTTLGIGGKWRDRPAAVAGMLQNLHCLGNTSFGHPRHPLYVPASQKPEPWKSDQHATIKQCKPGKVVP